MARHKVFFPLLCLACYDFNRNLFYHFDFPIIIPRVARIKIADVDDIAEGTTVKFEFTRDDRLQEGFVGRFKGKLFAYDNTCRHLPISLDYGDNRFFDSKGETLVCQTHGAVYEPETGLCTRGPCAGASLYALEVVEEDGVLWFDEASLS